MPTLMIARTLVGPFQLSSLPKVKDVWIGWHQRTHNSRPKPFPVIASHILVHASPSRPFHSTHPTLRERSRTRTRTSIEFPSSPALLRNEHHAPIHPSFLPSSAPRSIHPCHSRTHPPRPRRRSSGLSHPLPNARPLLRAQIPASKALAPPHARRSSDAPPYPRRGAHPGQVSASWGQCSWGFGAGLGGRKGGEGRGRGWRRDGGMDDDGVD